MASRQRLSAGDVIERAFAYANKHLVESKGNDFDVFTNKHVVESKKKRVELIGQIVADAVWVDHVALAELWDYEDFKDLFDKIKTIMKQRRLWRE
jgi:hypothetical protein